MAVFDFAHHQTFMGNWACRPQHLLPEYSTYVHVTLSRCPDALSFSTPPLPPPCTPCCCVAEFRFPPAAVQNCTPDRVATKSRFCFAHAFFFGNCPLQASHCRYKIKTKSSLNWHGAFLDFRITVARNIRPFILTPSIYFAFRKKITFLGEEWFLFCWLSTRKEILIFSLPILS